MSQRKARIEILAYKVESFDSGRFRDDLVAYNSNCIVLFFDWEGVWVGYKPTGIKISGVSEEKKLFFAKFDNPRLFPYFYPVLFLVNNFKVIRLFFSICLRYEVGVISIENTYVAAFALVIRKLRLVKRMVYLPGDWLAGSKTKRGMFSYLGSNVIFPLFDYLAARFSDITLNCTNHIAQARYEFWGRMVPKREMMFQNRLELRNKSLLIGIHNKKILFMGNIRADSGLELVIAALADIRRKYDIGLKLVGHYNERTAFLKQMAKDLKLDGCIEFVGFVERESLDGIIADCFCGINILTSKDSYTTKTLPAKIFDYLQYCLPVVVTKNIGQMAPVVIESGIGLVIEPDKAEFAQAVSIIYEKQQQYRQNITAYINCFNSSPTTDISKFFKD